MIPGVAATLQPDRKDLPGEWSQMPAFERFKVPPGGRLGRLDPVGGCKVLKPRDQIRGSSPPVLWDFVEDGRVAVAGSGSGAHVIAALEHAHDVAVAGDEPVEVGLPAAVPPPQRKGVSCDVITAPVNWSMNFCRGLGSALWQGSNGPNCRCSVCRCRQTHVRWQRQIPSRARRTYRATP